MGDGPRPSVPPPSGSLAMKIGSKLLLMFSLAILLMTLGTYFSVQISQETLRHSISHNSLLLAQQAMEDMDGDISQRIFQAMEHSRDLFVQEAVQRSNRDFARMADPQALIAERNRQWIEAPKNTVTPFMQELMSGYLARELREKQALQVKEYGFAIFPEMYVTNRYGVIIATTGRTSDYLQADEEWYQEAIGQKQPWLGRMEYDESSDTYASDIVIQLYDENQEFAGIFKAILNFKQVQAIMTRISQQALLIDEHDQQSSIHFKLTTRDGHLLFSTKPIGSFLSDLSGHDFMQPILKGGQQGYFVGPGNEEGEKEELYAYVRSKGPLGWILLLEQETEEIFAPVAALETHIWTITAVVLFIILVLTHFLTRSLTRPVSQLCRAAEEIGRGNLATPIPVATGDEIGVLASSFREMSHKLQSSQLQLLTAKEYNENIIGSINELLIVTSPEGKIESVNVAACAQLGYPKEELAGFPLERIVATKGAALQPARLRELITADEVQELDASFTTKEGKTIPVSLNGAAMPDNEGQLQAIILVARDMRESKLIAELHEANKQIVDEIEKRKFSEERLLEYHDVLEERVRERTSEVEAANRELQKEMEERLRTSEEVRKLSQAVTQSPVSVLITDPNGTIEYINPKFTKVTGYSPEEAIGQTPRLLKSGRQSKEFYEELWQTIKAKREWHGEFCNLKKNKEIFWESTSISSILDAQGEISHFVAVKEDITEKKCIAQELEQAKEQAERANKAKSQFLANMSHEIRTPMNAIIGMSHLLRQAGLPAKEKNFVQKISAASNTLLRLIDDILDFSKIEADRLELENLPFNLDDVLTNLSDLVGLKAQEKGLELVLAKSRDVPIVLVGDALRLGQVLTNLTNNAIKFTESGEVIIKIDVMTEADETVTLRFAIKDTGIGLSKEQLNGLFQPFTQADGSTTRKYGGTGLGLAICKKLVQGMRGKIWVESKHQMGSTFSFTALFGLQDTERRKYRLADDMLAMRVLIADVSQSAREALAHYLKAFSFVPTETSSETDALSAFRASSESGTKPYGLAILDAETIKTDEFSILRELTSNQGGRPLPILLTVARNRRLEVRKRLAKEGIDIAGMLNKPVEQSTLFDAIMELFGHAAKRNILKRNKIYDPEAVAALRGAQILLAEDNIINQEVAFELLTSIGVEVTVVDNGRKAVQAVESHAYDLVLMDIQMPLLDGLAATRQIRNSDSRMRNIPIVAMTANAMNGDRERSLAAGMNDHITKPIEPKQFYTCLCDWIGPDAAERRARVAPSPFGLEEKGKKPALHDLRSLEPLLKKLAKLLKNNDTAAARQLEKVKEKAVGTNLGQDLTVLESLINSYKFEEALAALNRLLERLTSDE